MEVTSLVRERSHVQNWFHRRGQGETRVFGIVLVHSGRWRRFVRDHDRVPFSRNMFQRSPSVLSVGFRGRRVLWKKPADVGAGNPGANLDVGINGVHLASRREKFCIGD